MLELLRLGLAYIVITYIEVYIHNTLSGFRFLGVRSSALTLNTLTLALILTTWVFLDFGKVAVTAVSVEYG